jgi:hypothetical protein
MKMEKARWMKISGTQLVSEAFVSGQDVLTALADVYLAFAFEKQQPS